MQTLTQPTLTVTELRIGNYVRGSNQYETETGTISRIGDDNSTWIDGSYFDVADLQPIPLTPEILEKAGFRKEKVVFAKEEKWYNADFRIRWDGKKVFLPLSKMDYYYLHQLQNLYYALTGEELQINL